MEANKTLPVAVRQAVANGLSAQFRAPVSVIDSTPLWPSQVFRCTLQSPAATIPQTVIVRLPREGTVARSGPALLDNERAALEHLAAVGSTLAPRFLVGGANARFVASEDLGVGPSLLDLLLGNDPEMATPGAIAFAHALGRLHTQTVGLTDASLQLVHAPPAVPEHWQQGKEAVALLGLPAPGQDVDEDVAEIAYILSDPGNFLALSSGDPSVVNCKVVNGSVRFFDFEEACFRHALIDAIVLRFFYPTGGPAWRLPLELTLAMETAYRTELAKGCPTAREEAELAKGMAAAGAAWMILRMVRLPRVDAGPDRDPWLLLPPGWDGPAPMRSRRR